MTLSELKFYGGEKGSKAFWRFSVSFVCADDVVCIKGLRFYPESEHILPPMMPKPFKGQIVEMGQKVRERLVEKIKEEIKDRVEYSLDGNERRAWSNEDIERAVITVFYAGDPGVLERFMNLTEERAKEIGAEVPTQADKDYVLRRLKEVLERG